MALKMTIIEDNFIIQMFLEEVAKQMGHEILGSADNGDDALELIAQKRPDLTLLDIGLSGGYSGIEVAEILNKEYDVPFVFITGNSEKNIIDRALNATPLHIIKKPIDEGQLQEEFKTIEKKLADRHVRH